MFKGSVRQMLLGVRAAKMRTRHSGGRHNGTSLRRTGMQCRFGLAMPLIFSVSLVCNGALGLQCRSGSSMSLWFAV